LGTRATAHGNLGDLARALADWTTVVERRRERAADGAEAAVADLALALNNLALNQCDRDRGEECLRSSREAVTLLEPMAGTAPALFAYALRRAQVLRAEVEDAGRWPAG